MAGNWWDAAPVVQAGGGAPPVPPGSVARPEYGGNAYEAPDGSILLPTKSGGVQVIKGGQSVGAEARTRIALSLGPMIQAQKTLRRREAAGVNPYNHDWGARMLEAIPFDDGAVARWAGGDDYQEYEQAARTYESSIMPLFSGAAVSPSEAKRMIRADLPQMNDTPETLRRKGQNREMRIREAARLMGHRDDPFAPEPPQVPGAGPRPPQAPPPSPRPAGAGAADMMRQRSAAARAAPYKARNGAVVVERP